MRLDTAASRSRSLIGVALSQAAAPRGFRRPTEFAAAAGGAYPVERVGCIRSIELARLNLSRKPPRPLKIAIPIKGRRFPAVVDQRPWSRIRRAPPFSRCPGPHTADVRADSQFRIADEELPAKNPAPLRGVLYEESSSFHRR
jgi:hypothetical protein